MTEYDKALKAWKEKEQGLRAYMQGYVDFAHVLYHMGLLKENEELKWMN